MKLRLRPTGMLGCIKCGVRVTRWGGMLDPALFRLPAFRLALPRTILRYAGGREITLGDLGTRDGLLGGINAVIVGNYLTSRLIHAWGEQRIMRWGQAATLGGITLMLGLGLAGVHSPLAVALPLLLTGLGHGLINPPALAGTVGVIC